MRMGRKEYPYSRTFKTPYCPKRGKKGYCDGKKYADAKCPMKYVFFALIAIGNGWKEDEGTRSSSDGESCPAYVEWKLNIDRKKCVSLYMDESDGSGSIFGLKHCNLMVIHSSDEKTLDVLGVLFNLVPKGEEAITKYLQEKLGASKDIGKKALRIASSYNEPRYVNGKPNPKCKKKFHKM